MSMKILVSGLLPYESGKTVFINLLLDKVLALGYRPLYVKPVAGHDGWFQSDTIDYSLKLGVLVGHDAFVIAEKIGLLRDIHLVSPLDLLEMPIDIECLNYNATIYTSAMEYFLKKLVLMRRTRFTTGLDLRLEYYVVQDNVNKMCSSLRGVFDELTKTLFNRSNVDVVKLSSVDVERILDDRRLYDEVDDVVEKFIAERGSDVVVIESYNDASTPTNRSLNVDYAIVVTPCKALLYSGDRYMKGVLALTIGDKPWLVKTKSLINVLGKPMRSYNIPIRSRVNEESRVFEEIVEFIMKSVEARQPSLNVPN